MAQDLDDQPDSDESEEEEAAPPSRGPFKLGKFCRLRAEVFHEFSHWGTSSHRLLSATLLTLRRTEPLRELQGLLWTTRASCAVGRCSSPRFDGEFVEGSGRGRTVAR